MTNVIRQSWPPPVSTSRLSTSATWTRNGRLRRQLGQGRPCWVAGLALDGVQARALEVVADDKSRNAKAALSGGLDQLYPVCPP